MMLYKSEQNFEEKQKGFYLHASAVNIGGKALIFLGHSTSGKSTISQLLSKKYPVISDDKVWVSQNNKCEWSVKDGDNRTILEETQKNVINSTKTFPILSFVRIFKSKKNEIIKINSFILCKHLIDAVFEVDNQRIIEDINLRKKWFHFTADLSKKYQGYHFNFSKKSIIIKIIGKAFEK